MRQQLRSHLTYANVISTLCLFLLLGGGSAVALTGSNTVFSDDIVNGEVKVADVGQGAVATDEIANGQVKAADIGDGEVMTAEIANGQVKTADIGSGEVRSGNVANDNLSGGDISPNSLKGADIDEATLDIGDAARAYARVVPGNCTGTPGTCTPTESKGVSSVTRAGTGFYCVHAPGIESLQTPAAVTVDWGSTAELGGSGKAGNTAAMTGEFACNGADGFPVFTQRQPAIGVFDQAGNPRAAVGPAEDADDVGFTIVIP
jgi:hypothetical protein